MPNITPSEDRTVETVHVPNNPTLTGLARLTRNVAYRTGADDLVMDIIAPQSTGDDDDRRYPTVVFVQGSACDQHRTVITRSRSYPNWRERDSWWRR